MFNLDIGVLEPVITGKNGSVIGGGVGISIHSTFRIVTENTVNISGFHQVNFIFNKSNNTIFKGMHFRSLINMLFEDFRDAEVLIGAFPDVGASYFLSRLPGFFGEYVGLTGARLNGAEMLVFGLGTHFVPSKVFVLVQCYQEYI
uniref:3-hydroxyisobutyryl-CoA hydrolase n=1 Tax=Helianthus annuus TaxID=4232 RepID=A0A251TMJ7_HELAN